MKIIIAGAGAVGTHLAELLSQENHDIILMDEDSDKTEHMAGGNYDLLIMNASPTSISGLKEAGVAHTDLFIAVTPEETKNITCCMLAHTLGAKKTVARVDNSEYTTEHYREVFKQMGIDSLVYPEELAAKEIIDGLKRSWVRQYWEVHNGALCLMGIKLREEASDLYGKPLKELCGPTSPFHIVALKRGEATIIPNGNTEILLGDIAYFMTTRKHIQLIRKIVGKENYADVRKAMIMGGGDITVHVAHAKPENISLKIIEHNEERCQQLLEQLDDSDIMVIHGDARDTDLLIDEGIRDVQGFAALTSNTENNILACLAAKRLGVRKTVAQVENMDYVAMAGKLDIGTIVNKKTIAASHIYRMMLDTDVANIRRLTIADADIAEFVAAEGSPITKKTIREFHFPAGITLGGLVRDGVGMSIGGNTQVLPGDCVVVFSKSGLIRQIDNYFAPPTSTLSSLISSLKV
jgi:trk system potassium uptake protein TrkA